ncbi:hypothetical protein ACFV3E_00635 [Streptomyces sp. NPDC059718]
MFVEIVLTALPLDRDEVEEALEAAFEADGEITGAGTGTGSCHLDLEVDDDVDRDGALRRIHRTLRELGASDHARVIVRD